MTFDAPGRVNLIGEHTDYTGGFVLPMAIPFATSAEIEPAADGLYHFSSTQFESTRTLASQQSIERVGDWSDYAVGVFDQLQKRAIILPPFTLRLSGNVPVGAGLSSSASVEVATAIAMLAHADATLPTDEIALLCQAAENDFVGSPCGIMDQFAVAAAHAEHALLLNTRDLTHELLPLNKGSLAGCRIVIANSMVEHSVAEGEYGVRRQQVEAGQQALRSMFPQLRDLGDTTSQQLAACRSSISAASYKRCLHIVTENDRVQEARTAMLAGDAVELGRWMSLSHASQRDNFECSTPEIDFLAETAAALPGCFGARLTGGGFGGCTVNLVRTAEIDSFQQALERAYLERFSLRCELYVCSAVDGAVRRALMNARPMGTVEEA